MQSVLICQMWSSEEDGNVMVFPPCSPTRHPASPSGGAVAGVRRSRIGDSITINQSGPDSLCNAGAGIAAGCLPGELSCMDVNRREGSCKEKREESQAVPASLDRKSSLMDQ